MLKGGGFTFGRLKLIPKGGEFSMVIGFLVHGFKISLKNQKKKIKSLFFKFSAPSEPKMVVFIAFAPKIGVFAPPHIHLNGSDPF